jgi:hypothetical protein
MASPTFHFANSGRSRQLGFGEEERERRWEKEAVDPGNGMSFFYQPRHVRATGTTYTLEK